MTKASFFQKMHWSLFRNSEDFDTCLPSRISNAIDHCLAITRCFSLEHLDSEIMTYATKHVSPNQTCRSVPHKSGGFASKSYQFETNPHSEVLIRRR